MSSVRNPVTKRVFTGTVVSAAMQKTIVVEVSQVKVHPKYGKRYTTGSKFKVHDEKGEYRAGDKVRFVECRPISKEKRWKVVGRA